MADQEAKTKGVADIVFLIDVTGSMQPCIEALKRNVGVFIDTLTTKDANNTNPVRDWRGKVVGYRDFESGDAEAFVDNPFVRDAAALKAQLASLRAEGGGDEPESLLDALFRVASMPQADKGGQEDPSKWRYRSSAARVVVVFTDATFKEKMVIPEAAGGSVSDVINVCNANRVILNIFAPEFPGYDQLQTTQKAEYNPITGGNPQQALADFTSDQKNFATAMEQLARTVSKSAEVVKL